MKRISLKGLQKTILNGKKGSYTHLIYLMQRREMRNVDIIVYCQINLLHLPCSVSLPSTLMAICFPMLTKKKNISHQIIYSFSRDFCLAILTQCSVLCFS